MLVIIFGVGASALLPPTRLRASHTDFSTTPSFALAHDSRPFFQWAPRGSSQAAFTLEVDDAATGRSIWRSNKISSSTPSFQYPDSAPALPPAATYTWRLRTHGDNGAVSPFAAAAFHIAPSPDTWSNVSWLGDAKLNVYSTTLDVHNAPATMTLYVAGLGISVVSVNGKTLNTLTTTPWTNNAHIVGYSSYNISGVTQAAGNKIVVALGNGWRDSIFAVRDPGDKSKIGAFPRMLRAFVKATYADGASRMVSYTGDGKWMGAQGPSTYDSVYNGENYDARVARALFTSSDDWVARIACVDSWVM